MLYLFNNYVLDADRRELRRDGMLLRIEPQVFDLLEYLIRNRERVVTKEDLLGAIWKGRIVSDATLSSRITAARCAIGDDGEGQRLIRTLHRKGVRFVGTVREEYSLPIVAVASEPPTPTFAGEARPSVAVLPFANMSGDPEQEYFADGMAEEIVTALSRCNWLLVIARNSSFTYKGKTVDVRQIGRELGVRYVLEGSVRRSGNRLRITGELIDATSGTQIWADRFDGEMSDIFDLQDRITESVVATIEPKLQRAEIERLKHKPAGNLDAYEHLLRAQQLEYEFTEESLAAALRCLKQALAIDPSYAPAMALAAYCHAERHFQGWVSKDDVNPAAGVRLAWRAVELGKDDANVLWMAAFAIWTLAQDAQRSRELFGRSLQINPNSAIALTMAGWVESFTGHPDKGRELLERARRLSPRDPREWFMSTGMAIACIVDQRFDEAIIWAEKALVQNSRFAVALRALAVALAKVGQRESAAKIVEELLKIEPQLTISGLRSRVPFVVESMWKTYSDALRLAGLPE